MASVDHIGQILLQARLLDFVQLRSALARWEQWGGRLPHHVVEMGLCSEERVVEALSRGLRYPIAPLENAPVDREALGKVEAAYAEARALFPFQLKESGRVLVLAMADPGDLEAIDTISRKGRVRVVPMLAGEGAIHKAIRLHYFNDRRTVSSQELSKAMFPGERELSAEELGDTGAHAVPVEVNASSLTGQFEAPAEIVETGTFLSQALTDSQMMLAEILNGSTAPVFSPEQEARILTLSENQKKTDRILQAVEALLADKTLR